MTTTAKKGIFISHIHEEVKLGAVVKEWLTDAFPGTATAFLSSDKQDIAAGEKWLDKIANELAGTGVMVSLLSPQSLARPWVNIELGAAWIKGVPIVPLCHSGLAISDLPRLFSDFTSLTLDDDPAVARHLVAGVANALGLGYSQRLDFAQCLKDMRTAATQSKPGPTAVAAPTATGSLPPEQVAILQMLATVQNQGHDDIEEPVAVRMCGLSPTVFKYHADELSEAELINPSFWGEETHFEITAKGAGWLIKNGQMPE
jgi:hypothetical protein